MKNSSAVILFLLCVVSILAKGETRVGLMAGLDLSSANVSLTTGNLTFSNGSGARAGFAGGAFVEQALSPIFYLQPELMYVQEGGNWSNSSGTFAFDYDCLELPVLLKAKLGNQTIQGEIFTGPGLSINLAKSLSVSSNSGSSTSASPNDINSVDISLQFGAGVEVAIAPTASVFLDARYMLGLLNLVNYQNFTGKLSGFLFLGGVSLAI